MKGLGWYVHIHEGVRAEENSAYNWGKGWQGSGFGWLKSWRSEMVSIIFPYIQVNLMVEHLRGLTSEEQVKNVL